jgi:hypothetical protein
MTPLERVVGPVADRADATESLTPDDPPLDREAAVETRIGFGASVAEAGATAVLSRRRGGTRPVRHPRSDDTGVGR